MRYLMNIVCLIVMCLALYINTGYGQLPGDFNTTYNKDVIPPSPSAAKLNKGGDVRSNLSTGAPTATVPLYTVKSRQLAHAITLNYASNGIRINEMASPEGLGWSLSCGGAVNRTVLGIPDEKRQESGYTNFNNFNTDFSAWTNAIYDYAMDNNTYDKQSDIFTIDVANIHLKFILDSSFTPRPLKSSLVKILKIGTSVLDGFVVKDPRGIIYRFDVPESSRQEIAGFQGPHYQQAVITSWYLSAIVMPGQDTVSFSYINNNYSFISASEEGLDVLMSITPVDQSPCTPSYSEPYSKTHHVYQTTSYITGKVLSGISFADGKVELDYVPNRLDDGGVALSKIEVLNNKLEVKRRITFVTDYFIATDTVLPQLYLINKPSFKYRLYLKELKIEGIQNGTAGSTSRFTFTYNNGGLLPARFSTGQDWFGYFNGKTTNSSVLPDVSIDYPNLYQKIGQTLKGNRDPDTIRMAYGQLSKIVYPTGGYDTLEYDYNKQVEERIEDHRSSFSLTCITSASASSAQNEDILHLPTQQNINSIHFQLFATGTAPEDPIHDRATITIKNNTSGAILWTTTLSSVGSSATKNLSNLAVGDYTVKLTVSGRGMEGAVNFFYESAPPDTIAEYKPLGGLNIHRIISFDMNGHKTTSRRFDYIYRLDSSISTFSVSGLRQMWATSVVPQMFSCTSGEQTYSCLHEANNMYLNVSSNTLNPETILGSSPAYNRSVLEYVETKDSALLTEHRFLYHGVLGSNIVIGDKILNTPYCVYNDLMYGENLTNYYVQDASQSYRLIRSSENTYSEDTPEEAVFNYNVRKKCTPTCRYSVPSNNHELLCLDIERYPVVFTKDLLLKHKQTDYILPGTASIKDSIEYTYGNAVYPVVTQEKHARSDAKTVIITYKYPFNYTGTIYDSMVVRNIFAAVEQKYTVSGIQTKRNVTGFGFFNGKKIVLADLFQTQNRTAVINNVFQVNLVDAYGNLREQQKTGDVKQVYLWGYNGMYPVAKIIGSDYNSVKVLVDSLKLSNAFNYSDAAIRIELNKIRSGLASTTAQVYTYTYLPMVGMSSATDPKGNITYYEYDSMGRLKNVKDNNGNVVQTLDYHYRQ